MTEQQNTPYTISDDPNDVRRVVWKGPLDTREPALDAERIAIEAAGKSSQGLDEDRVELDLSQCQWVTSGGIALLVYLRRRLAHYDTEWSIVGAPVALLRALELLNLDAAFELRSLPAMAALFSPDDSSLTAVAGDPASSHRGDTQHDPNEGE